MDSPEKIQPKKRALIIPFGFALIGLLVVVIFALDESELREWSNFWHNLWWISPGVAVASLSLAGALKVLLGLTLGLFAGLIVEHFNIKSRRTA